MIEVEVIKGMCGIRVCIPSFMYHIALGPLDPHLSPNPGLAADVVAKEIGMAVTKDVHEALMNYMAEQR